MDMQGAVMSSQDLKKDRNLNSLGQQSHVASEQALGQPNGLASQDHHGSLANGGPTTAADTNNEIVNGGHKEAMMTSDSKYNPPELDQTWRSTDANKSLGKLVDRLAQQCFFDLHDTITKMADVGPPQATAQVNGVVPHSAQDNDNVNLEKKRILLNFANDQRDRFIKTLVLSDWSKREAEMARLIDVKVEQDKKRFAYKFAANSIAEIKRRTSGFKQQAPNIEGAIELLATSTAAWVPDLNYIPAERLSAKQLLRTLKDMNVTLATRLNLHEELPQCMQDFTIVSGRATFSVPGEFEVDLSVADEDPTSTFYFIDIRLCFQPSPGTLDERLRPHLEAQVNDAIKKHRLQGCYDFLHNFVLTHKINTLRSQAADLIRGKWFDCIKVENMRRSMIVRYWMGMPGAKSWFEIGVISGKDKTHPSRKPTSRLAVRWFRKGVEVTDEQLDFDWTNLDLEQFLATVIDKHATYILRNVRERIMANTSDAERKALKDQGLPVPANAKALAVDGPAIESESECTALFMRMPTLRAPLTLRIDRTTGQYSLSPPSAATLNREARLNGDPALDMPRYLMALLCAVVQENIQKQAELLGWSIIQNLALARPKFGDDVFQRNVFCPSQSWGQNWGLGVSIGLGGEKWWIVQLEETKPNDQSKVNVENVISAKQLSTGDAGELPSSTTSSRLLQLERLAVAEVSFTVLAQQLRSLRIPFQVEAPIRKDAHADSDDRQLSVVSSAVFVRFSPLMHTAEGTTWKPWAAETLRISHHGLEEIGVLSENGAPALVQHDLRLSLEPGKMQHLQKHLSTSRDTDLVTNATGGLALRLRTPFGKPFVEQIQKRLLNVARLNDCVTTLDDLQFTCKTVSLGKLAFTYGIASQLSARLTFSNDGGIPIKLKLEPADVNPHLRIRVYLESMLNGPRWFRQFALTLSTTLPLLRTLQTLEANHVAHQCLVVRPRSATWYHLSYKAPLPKCVFHLRARVKSQANRPLVRWHLEAVEATGWTDDLKNALKELWQDKGEGWFGIGNGVIANIDGIAQVLEKLDEVVRQFEEKPDPSKPTEGKNASTEQPAKATSPSAPATKAKTGPDVITLDD